jgi:hypothetical protein
LGDVIGLSQAVGGFFRKQPAVARDQNGNFLVVWESEYQDGSLWGIFGRRFDNQGQPLGEEFQVNTHSEEDQAEPVAAASPSGELIVAWMSFGQDGDLGGVFGQRFDQTGSPQGSEFQINTTTAGHQGSPFLGFDTEGDFVVAWESGVYDSGNTEILAQRFDRLGRPVGTEIQVVSASLGNNALANLAVEPNGDFEVVWYTYSSEENLLASSSRRFNSNGEPLD